MKISPDAMLDMPFPQVLQLLTYWQQNPPEHELLAILAAVHGWKPSSRKLTEAEAIAEHRRSLQARWASGAAMDARQILGAGGQLAGGRSMWPPQQG